MTPARQRCPWSVGNALYEHYHDTEWGVPCRDDRQLFEFLILEGAQAGLSWITVLRKRENYRRAFAEFDAERVARFNRRSVERLMADPGIARNRQKIEATIGNARQFLALQERPAALPHTSGIRYGSSASESLAQSLRSAGDHAAVGPHQQDMKRLGFRFVGSTICYAHRQATGMVNDHLVNC